MDAASLNRTMVLENDVVFGSVSANRRHYEAAVKALERADPGWLRRIVTRRVPIGEWPAAVRKQDGDVKTVVEFGA